MTDRTRDELMTLVRDADTVTPGDRSGWATSAEADAVLGKILASEILRSITQPRNIASRE